MKKMLLLLVAILELGRAAHAEPVIPEVTEVARCQAIVDHDFSGIPDAPTAIIAASHVAATGEVPAHCRVNGHVSSQVGFALLMPTNDWNGKFLEVGCGGFCGSLLSAGDGVSGTDCDDVLRRGYACLGSDQGHRGGPGDGLWAFNNLEAQVDYGLRAAHVAALAGKAITERFYSRAASRSYFWGCSDGGRQAMVEAQQFPTDFDGIVAGAPAMHMAGAMVRLLWYTRVARDHQGNSLFSAADAKRVHDVVVAKCDMNDGVRDGLIGDPRACRFDASDLACKSGSSSACLSPAQLDAVMKLIAGPTNSRGESVYFGDVPGIPIPDSFWWLQLPEDFFRYMGFAPAPGPSWKLADFDFDRDPRRLDLSDSLNGGANPDLRKFKAAGGKLLLFHGWADSTITPLSTIDYFDTTERTMGGSAATRDFLRLYMVPGMEHCGGGDGAFAIDFLAYLEAWVEKGEAPERIIGEHPRSGIPAERANRVPLNPSDVEFSRPFYPYPIQTRYKGSGNERDAENFVPARP